ncbi:hypothetical protein SSAG_04398 [Streptomyces sp. Mg1]|nr:hypothetical protein SSAG_04398 [Streptomyces sp. Mg1]
MAAGRLRAAEGRAERGPEGPPPGGRGRQGALAVGLLHPGQDPGQVDPEAGQRLLVGPGHPSPAAGPGEAGGDRRAVHAQRVQRSLGEQRQ